MKWSPPRSISPLRRFFTRQFHATSALSAKPSHRRLEHLLRNVPKYPYPIKHTFKQAWFGLYGGKHIQFGNNVPDNFLRYKTRRQWMPNVRHRSVYSRALGMHFSLNITTSVLRTIDKAGGLDAYLTGTKAARLKELGPVGWRLRWRVLNSPYYQKRLKLERRALGLEDGKRKGPVIPAEPEQADVMGLLEDAFSGVEEEAVPVVKGKEKESKSAAPSAAQELMADLQRARARRGQKKL